MRAELDISDGQRLVVGVGRLVPQKQPLVFLEMAAKLHEQDPEARFVWVGDGELSAEWQAAVIRKGLSGVVSCAGWKSDVRPYLAAADLLLHTAEFEGLPFALIEAMSMGVPCAMSRSVASELPFLDASNAIVYDDGGQLEQVVARPQALREVGEAARVLMNERFSDHAMAASYEELYAGQMASAR
jgi:glycosyltransferase involved in cell wall biosynthesis